VTTPSPAPLLTTSEVAQVLQIHPKQVYRLVRQGLPGRRVGGEWRFLHDEVIGWVERGGSAALPADGATATATTTATAVDAPPPFLAANGDVAVEALLSAVNATAPVLAFLQSDLGRAIDLLRRGRVLVAGSHGDRPPARLGEVRLARIHLVRREIGLVAPPGRKLPRVADLARLRFAGRPATAGVSLHLERALREAGVDPRRVAARAHAHDSHREVVCAVLRGEADVGLATRAWAHRVGLAFRLVVEESYGLLIRAADLGDPRVVRLCEVAQGERYRRMLAGTPGYDLTGIGDIRYDPEPSAAS
jgi:excisionase family DNA binding protein